MMANTLQNRLRRVALSLLASVMMASLLACGGGGATQGSTAGPASGADASHGAFTLGMSGGAYRDVSHVWITVASVALHPLASQAWSSTDRSWTVLRLTTPVVLDLAVTPSGSQGDVTRILSGLSVPAGTYGQIRLFPLGHDAELDSAAAAKGLSYNAQVNYTDGNAQAHVVPLELAQTELGWRLAEPYTVSAQGASYVVVQADLQHDLVRMASTDGVDHFTFRPSLTSYDMSTSGAIIGAVDTSLICGGASAPAAPNCAEDIVVSAQRLSADGLRHTSVRQYKVSSSGGFALYPLPSETRFDIVVTGRHMQTMLIKDVAVSPFSVLTTLDWTTLSTPDAPLRPVITPQTPRTVNLAAVMSPPGSQLFLGQTVGSVSQPYEVAVANVDVLSGVLAHALALPQGPVSMATYMAPSTDSSTGVTTSYPLVFADVVPQEGSHAFSVQALGTAYDDPGSVNTVSPALGVSSTISVADPVRRAALGVGQIQVNLTGALSSSYDGASVIVSDVQGVVVTQAVSGRGRVVISVPAGAQAAASAGMAVYAVALRAAGHNGALRWVRASATVDLRSTASASVTLALP